MRKTLVTLAAIALATTLAACGDSSTPTTAGGATSGSGSASSGTAPAAAAPTGLIDSASLSVCIDPEYAPLEYFEGTDTSNPVGFDADSARALGALWGVETTWQITSFDGLMPALQAQRCDIVWSGLYTSAERLAVADAAPYLKTGPGLLVAAGTTDITDADSLSGKTVAVQGGGANEATLQTLSDEFTAAGKEPITIQPYPKVAETVAAVTNGKAQALIETDVAVGDIVAKSGGALAAVAGVFPTETEFGVFTTKGSALTPSVAAGIKTLASDGTLATIATTYGLDPTKIAS
ncbi:transporter substrate-binding domain-containing protein [Nakamurella deserti]|uniref:transporter substrate-binding domain-containing protein n=1 Tax=Nakamurella deserti TaxID=2164074 RepID=UPI000DBE59CB|nr:transporter substrate-binding domain-containing protein [Nakamurella deserti]